MTVENQTDASIEVHHWVF